MKKRMVKRLLALGLSAVMVMGFTACGSKEGNSSSGDATSASAAEETADATSASAAEETADATSVSAAEETADATSSSAAEETVAEASSADDNSAAPADGGTIIWLAQMTSGRAYDAYVTYGEYICEQLGYKFQVVYGDQFNDPAGNLSAVQTGMTSDVVGIISSQDGGVQNILEEYPDLYYVGLASDMASVYSEGGASAAALDNDKFLGTIVDGYADGTKTGHDYAQAVINGGYKKVGTCSFPPYAYPNLAKADGAFREEIAAYNETVGEDEKIEVVGDVKILEFAPLDESWFMEGENGNLDAIAAFCAGVQFVYPTMKSAMANGTCSADTKLLTGGFEIGDDIIADIGGEGVIQWIDISPFENLAWSVVLLDNALQGKQYADFSPECIDSARYVIDSKEDIDNVMAKSLVGTLDPANAQISFEDLKSVLTRYNPDATYAQLNELFHSEQLKVDALQ